MLTNFIKKLVNLFTPHRVYFVVDQGRVIVDNLTTGYHFEGLTQYAIDLNGKHKQIVAVSNESDLKNCREYTKKGTVNLEIINWYDISSRTIVDFQGFEACLRYMLYVSRDKSLLAAVNPFLIMHIIDKVDYSKQELKKLKQLKTLGASVFSIWKGRRLLNHEIISGEIVGDGWVTKKPIWVK